MNDDLQPQHAQLFYDTQLSLHQYHKAITSLIVAVENISSKEISLTVDTREIPTYIKDTLLDIQTLQLKKLRLFYKEKPAFFEQTYLQPMLNATKDIKKPKTSINKPRSTFNKPSKTPVRTNEIEPQKNMVSLKINLSGGVKETFSIEGKPLPPWIPNL